MINYQVGDLILVDFPFGARGESKIRPSMVLLDTGDNDVLTARVTTKIYSTPCDVFLNEWKQAGLIAPSCVRLHKQATLEKTTILRQLGHVGPNDRPLISVILHQLFAAW